MLTFLFGVFLGIGFMYVVALIKKDCIRCNRSSCATICEACYHEILTENMKIKMQLQTYKQAMVEVENDILDNHVPSIN
jgi:hypothetical protein